MIWRTLLKPNVQRNKPAIIGLIAFVIALIVAISRGINDAFQNDAKGYVGEALGMLEGWTFMQENPEKFGHGFGFTGMILSTFLMSGTTSLVFLKLILALAHGASSYLVARIGQLIGLKEKFWIAASMLFTIDPFMLFAATDAQTESLTTLLILWWCYLYVSKSRAIGHHWPLVILFTLSGIFSVLMRPNSLLPFVFVAFILYRKWIQEGVKNSIFAISISLFLGSISLYQLFLTKLYSGFIFLSTAGAANAEFMCRKEFIPQYFGLISAEENKKINAVATQSTTTQELLSINPNLTIPELNREYTKLGISTCLEDPIGSITVITVKFFALWRPFTGFGAYGIELFLFSLILWLPMTLAAIWYLISNQRNESGNAVQRYFIVMSLGFTLSLLLTATQIRHRVAFAEPFYWIFLLYFLQRLYQRFLAPKPRVDLRKT
jgi:hypothetical protein